MRTIKFRVWHVNNKMIYIDETCYLILYGGEKSIQWGLYSHKDGYRLVTGGSKAILNIPGYLMQYTNLKDQTGKEIYEKDIAKMQVEYGGENFYLNGWHIGEVRIIASMGVCIYNPYFKNNNGEDYRQKGYWKLRAHRTKIIGNIYEHNHLINGQ